MNTKTAHKHLELTTKALTLLAKLKASDYVAKMTKRVKATIKRLKAVLRKAINPSKALPVTVHQDTHNASKTWLIKRSKHGHYFLNHAIDGDVVNTRYTRTTIKHIKSLGLSL